MSYRSDLDALEARHAALDAELSAKTKERDATSRLLVEAKARARLPILDNIRVATPCRADWNAMTGDDRVRACSTCEKQVFNISEMTREEAEALIVERNGNLCVRYYRRTDGTILLADCKVGIAAARARKVIAVGAAALLASAVALRITHRGSDAEAQDITMSPPAEATAVRVTGAVPTEQPPAPLVVPKPIEVRKEPRWNVGVMEMVEGLE